MITILALEARPQLELRTSPELIAYAELLALTAVELEQAVDRELELNPALERLDRPVCPFCSEPLAGTRCPACVRRPVRDAPPAGALPAQPSGRDLLLAELRPLVAAGDVPVLEYLIASLDERGYLDVPPPSGRAARVLGVLRRHGPPGIGARDLRECLLLQLGQMTDEPQAPLAHAIVARHLEDLAAGAWSRIASALGATRDDVARAAEFIRTRLRPSVALEPATPTPLALPDVIVREREGGVAVELVEPSRLQLVVSPGYPDAQTAQAHTFLQRLERRWQTTRAVAELAVRRQHAFVAGGPRFIAPLTRAQIAAELGVHESTVSRATNGRYVLLPSGRVIPFSRFFDAAQGPCAALAQLVAEERSPQSDASLAAELARLGFPVARRTVAKYRERLGIPERRRREAAFVGDGHARSELRASSA